MYCLCIFLIQTFDSSDAFNNNILFFYCYEDDAGRMKRKRKPSEKVLELQAEKVKKPSKSSKLAKPKSKSLADQDNGNGFHGDGLYDE